MKASYWWLSFVDPTKPAGHASLGVCVVPVTVANSDIGNASLAAWEAGCNPGGEVAGWQLCEQPPPWFPLNTLLSREQVEAFQREHGLGGRETTAGKEDGRSTSRREQRE